MEGVCTADRAGVAPAWAETPRRAAGALLATLDAHPRRWLVAILTLALALRVLVVLLFPETIISLGNREKNDQYATSFVTRGIFGETAGPLADRPGSATRPAYAWFLIAIYTTLGRGTYTIGLSQALLSTANVLLVFLIARRLVQQRAAILAAAAMAVYPYSIWHDVHVVRTGLDAFFSLASVLLLLELARTGQTRCALGAGASMVMATQTTNMLVGFIPVAILWLLIAWRDLPRASLAGAALIVGATLALAPWVARNYELHNRFVLLSTDNGIAFLNNNNPFIADAIRANLGPDNVGPQVMSSSDPRWSLPEAELDRLLLQEGLNWIRSDPAGKLDLMVLNAINYWDPTIIRPKSNTFFEGNETIWQLKVTLYRLSFGPIFLLGLACLLYRLRRDRTAWLVAALFGFTTLLYASTYGSTRYRIPLDGLLAAYAAEALVVGLARVATGFLDFGSRALAAEPARR